MYHFFVDSEAFLENGIQIRGEDVNHIKNVLRLKCGEQIIISRKNSTEEEDYYCNITEITDDYVMAHIDWTEAGRELNNKIYLFQGLPKSDKMELIIQKAVELGVHEIIPVAARRSVVKLDNKKEESKIKRWQAISESAAKQSKRSIIPKISQVMTFKEAASYAAGMDVRLMPYENAKGIAETRRIISEIQKGESIAVLIGPEGGFDPEEVEIAEKSGFHPVTLGKRILRTETAGLMMLSVLMYNLEE
ncbi:MAG: 16S rRNA (uracil(1498)-N(3))-methyltransferase [Thermoflexaceae bacterium]|nr:16S rRNA (uracil(1498)-N(3))-methyltransferase [Thermoflexaceae bacterium]